MNRKEVTLALDGNGAFGPAVVKGIIILVGVSTVSFMMGTTSLHDRYSPLFDLIETTSVVAFSVEYALRLWVASDPWDYAKQPVALFDLFSVLPSWVDACIPGDNFPALQFLRMLR